MLEAGADLVLPSQVEQEGERVDVGGPAQEHGQLRGKVKAATQPGGGSGDGGRAAAPGAKGYEGPDDEQRVKDVGLEGEERQAHVGEDEVLRQEVEELKQLKEEKTSGFWEPTCPFLRLQVKR